MASNPPLWVNLSSQSRQYPIHIQRDILSKVGELTRSALPQATSALVVTQSAVHDHYGDVISASLIQAGLQIHIATIPQGETAKSLAQAEQLYQVALDFGLSRKDPIIALGGGVVGDLAGFVAATYFRGTPFIQIPTTLLAQVDSSVGGKVAVNFATSKNGVGCFYQPTLVVIEPNTLSTLPERESKAGLAEVIKYGLIESSITGDEATFFSWLESKTKTPWQTWSEQDDNTWETLITRCCQLKATVVQKDETETSGLRALLNLGHTFGHTYEALTNYTSLLHGEAVAIGLVDACRLSHQLGWCDASLIKKTESLLKQVGMPLTRPQQLTPRLDTHRILELMRHDKKASGGQFTLILPKGPLGNAVVTNHVSEAEIRTILE